MVCMSVFMDLLVLFKRSSSLAIVKTPLDSMTHFLRSVAGLTSCIGWFRSGVSQAQRFDLFLGSEDCDPSYSSRQFCLRVRYSESSTP